ncbi:hypothetical protein AMS58_10270 [Pseudoalteromonas porphyrae]|uniref:Orphan protein n=2 Tax=Pseudoalteromonas TaxID=53246 RepID=A0A0N1EE47_9GAMM|nr:MULTISPECIES: hypothetical protein [Pseudoalteromonas]KPH57740.1 hypothetical protein ADS77_18760 [Pseudoalteromonas porphyrae]KPH94887.1 hypothetical protein AMS58_10270 [Pseudoalteromonas porphyrae]NMR24936.1 hypothetical protein [Pseudoalteromonas sp. NEC-BIFX-2020_015]NNG43649.1 hypothetical protein [Pseudoalteromonas sp. NEC-BIFX-2020_002]
MELEQNSNLTLPLFLFDDTLNSRDLETPDLLLTVVLDETVLAQLCQNPGEDSSIGISITDYQLEASSPLFLDLLNHEHQAQLTLTHGPLLSAMLDTDSGQTFVSPQMDMMPTFDLGDEDE